MMSTLNTESFPEFVQATTGYRPFPWQTRLLQRVLSDGDDCGWPDLLDLPTGSGKTTALHVAVYAMAMRPESMPRRIALVVDRRVIVDQVHAVARELAAQLDAATSGAAYEVAKRLRACSSRPDAAPLRGSLLRGGVPRDDSWIQTLDQPTIFASTVDQVGSRLLFRGYGVSPGMRPVHAGVLSRDTLYLLDEVHLASAFEKTLSDLCVYGGRAWKTHEGPIGRPIQVARMSATPRSSEAAQSRFSLNDEDRSHPVLAQRLEASRPARLEFVKTKSSKDAAASNTAAVAKAAAAAASELAGEGARVVGVIVNRVATAVATSRALAKTSEGPVYLLTGRMRPSDRERVSEQIERIAKSGSSVADDAHPVFVVATSCIEAGADYDFDGMVTEVASLPALRQRFGRLNRLGRHDHAQAVILGAKHLLSKSAGPDPIYGEALANTWRFLEERAQDGIVDFGLAQFPAVEDSAMETMRTADVPPPTMFPRYLDLWSETRPAPHPDPEVSLWLHGKEHEVDDEVSLVFRSDASPDASASASATESLDFISPLPEEALPVPLWQARSFIDARSEGEVARVTRWSAEGAEQVDVGGPHTGDVVVVPANWGGLTHGTWDPAAMDPVVDIAERVYLARHRAGFDTTPLLLRVNPALMSEEPELPPPPSGAGSENVEAWNLAQQKLDAWLERSPSDTSKGWLSDLRRAALTGGLVVTTRVDVAGTGWLVAWRERGRGLTGTTEDAVSSFSGIDVSLSAHLDDVQAWARDFAVRAGLSEPLAEDVALAAWLHDIGKADRRFQILLRGGDPIAAHSGPALAKSALDGSARTRAVARQRSGWPRGFRHELISLALFDSSEEIQAQAHDVELVRHLIASHHGWCRPWAPSCDDENPQRVRFDLAGETLEVDTSAINETLRADAASRFARLTKTYGWHGLAYLEALLRLGDHQASRAPSTRPSTEQP